jgi:hypothetical protein
VKVVLTVVKVERIEGVEMDVVEVEVKEEVNVYINAALARLLLSP